MHNIILAIHIQFPATYAFNCFYICMYTALSVDIHSSLHGILLTSLTSSFSFCLGFLISLLLKSSILVLSYAIFCRYPQFMYQLCTAIFLLKVKNCLTFNLRQIFLSSNKNNGKQGVGTLN